MERLIFHIDVNSAFLSWESVHRLKEDPEALDLPAPSPPLWGEMPANATVSYWPNLPLQKNTASSPVSLLHRPGKNVLPC